MKKYIPIFEKDEDDDIITCINLTPTHTPSNCVSCVVREFNNKLKSLTSSETVKKLKIKSNYKIDSCYTVYNHIMNEKIKKWENL